MDDEKNSSHFRLYFSNNQQENDSKNDSKTFSSADHFEILLQEQIDLNDLLNFRSNRAEMSIETFCISGLPLTLTRYDNISVLYKIDESTVFQNSIYKRKTLLKENEKTCKIFLTDLISHSPVKTLSHLNTALKKGTEKFMLLKTIETYVDRLIFTDSFKYTVLSEDKWGISEEIGKLLSIYLEMADFCRETYILGINKMLNLNFVITTKNYRTSALGEQRAKQIVSSNPNVFLPFDKIKGKTEIYQTIKLDTSYNNSLRLKENHERLRASLWTQYHRTYLRPKLTYKRKEGEENNELNLSDQSKSILADIKDSLFTVYSNSANLHKLLKKEVERAGEENESNQEASIITLSECPATKKCRFQFKTEESMIPSSEITLQFDNQTSHVLGNDDGILTIGPLRQGRENLKRSDHLNSLYTNTITFEDQLPFFVIRPQPKLVYVLSDLVTNLSHYKSGWLKDEKFCPILSIPISEKTFDTNFLAMSPNQKTHYYPLHKAERILNRFQIQLTDEFFRKITFPRKTYVHFCLNVRPY